MSNFIEEFKKGQVGKNKGLPFGESFSALEKDLLGVQRGKMFTVAGGEKTGKTTFTDYIFVIQPYLYALENNIPVKWIYYSFEISRVNKEFDFMCYFLYHDFGVYEITLPEGITRNGQNKIQLSSSYLKGHLVDDNGNVIKVSERLLDAIKTTYSKRITPLFGEYDRNGLLIKEGLIRIRERADNPTGIYKDLIAYAKETGTLYADNYNRPISYVPKDENNYTIVVIDHIRKLVPERGWQMKQTIDKMSEYIVILKSLLNFAFVPIIHTNRGLTNIDRLSYFKSDLYPTAEDLKDSGNLGEDCDYLLTLFNPNDDKYNLKEHFGLKIKDNSGNPLFPNLKTIHLVSSRHCEFPKHYAINMFGNIKEFVKINNK